jgi:hypothetical protein
MVLPRRWIGAAAADVTNALSRAQRPRTVRRQRPEAARTLGRVPLRTAHRGLLLAAAVAAGATCLAGPASASTVTLTARVQGSVELLGISSPVSLDGVDVRVPFFWQQFGKPVQVFGQVLDDGSNPPPPTQVTIVAQDFPFEQERTVQTVTTSADGRYAVTVPHVPRTTVLTARVPTASENLSPAVSTPLILQVGATIRIASQKRVSQTKYAVKGTLGVATRPARLAGSLFLQPLVNGIVRGQRPVPLAADGSFAIPLSYAGKPPGMHTYNYRLVFRPTSSAEYTGWDTSFTTTVTIPTPIAPRQVVQVRHVDIPQPDPPPPPVRTIDPCGIVEC